MSGPAHLSPHPATGSISLSLLKLVSTRGPSGYQVSGLYFPPPTPTPLPALLVTLFGMRSVAQQINTCKKGFRETWKKVPILFDKSFLGHYWDYWVGEVSNLDPGSPVSLGLGSQTMRGKLLEPSRRPEERCGHGQSGERTLLTHFTCWQYGGALLGAQRPHLMDEHSGVHKFKLHPKPMS